MKIKSSRTKKCVKRYKFKHLKVSGRKKKDFKSEKTKD